jgi:hypothetical protein
MSEADGGTPAGGLDAELEEIREYIAAAFDAVGELGRQLPPLVDAVQKMDGQMASVQQGVIEGMSTLARALDERLERLGRNPSAEAIDASLTETISTSLAAINRRLQGVGRVGPVLTDLAAWMSGMVERQDKVEAELIRLADEVQSYRRRTQLKARPPLLSDEQADSIVGKVLDGLAGLAAQQRVQEQARLEPSSPSEASPAERRRRRR